MFALNLESDIGAQATRAALAELSAQQARLASSLPYFKQQVGSMMDVAGHLRNNYFQQAAKCKQLVQREPKLLQQLSQVIECWQQRDAAGLGPCQGGLSTKAGGSGPLAAYCARAVPRWLWAQGRRAGRHSVPTVS